MSVILFLLLLILIFSLGLGVCLCCEVEDLLEQWGLAWLLGTGLGTFVWFLVNQWWSVRFSEGSLFGVLIGANCLTWLCVGIFRRNFFQKWLKKVSRLLANSATNLRYLKKITLPKSLSTALICLLVFLSVFMIFQDLFWPVTDWDALALYDFRAKIMVQTGSLASGVKLGYFFQYPLYTSALHAATYFTGLMTAKIWYAIIYQSMIVLFFRLLSKRSSRVMSLFGAVLLATSPGLFQQAYTAYTNLPYVVFTAFGFIYLWQRWEDGSLKNQFIGALLVGLGTWVRISEPFYFIAALMVVAGQIKWAYIKWRSAQLFSKKIWVDKKIAMQIIVSVLACLLIFFIRYPWDHMITVLFGKNVNTPISSLSLVTNWSPMAFLNRTSAVIIYLSQYSLSVYVWYLALAAGMFALDICRKNYRTVFMWASIFLILGMIFAGTLLLSFSLESWNRIGDSVARLSYFLIPLLIYLFITSPSWSLPRKKRT